MTRPAGPGQPGTVKSANPPKPEPSPFSSSPSPDVRLAVAAESVADQLGDLLAEFRETNRLLAQLVDDRAARDGA